jgi:hypothetical protein
MDAKTLEALKGSIAHWEKNAQAGHPYGFSVKTEDCPLCDMFINNETRCSGCPVMARTGSRLCADSPYDAARWAMHSWREYDGTESDYGGLMEAAHKAAQAEVDFLKSLLPEEAP